MTISGNCATAGCGRAFFALAKVIGEVMGQGSMASVMQSLLHTFLPHTANSIEGESVAVDASQFVQPNIRF